MYVYVRFAFGAALILRGIDSPRCHMARVDTTASRRRRRFVSSLHGEELEGSIFSLRRLELGDGARRMNYNFDYSSNESLLIIVRRQARQQGLMEVVFFCLFFFFFPSALKTCDGCMF